MKKDRRESRVLVFGRRRCEMRVDASGGKFTISVGMDFCCFFLLFTLPETNIAMENPPFGWYLPRNMGIFHGYVSLQEGSYMAL